MWLLGIELRLFYIHPVRANLDPSTCMDHVLLTEQSPQTKWHINLLIGHSKLLCNIANQWCLTFFSYFNPIKAFSFPNITATDFHG